MSRFGNYTVELHNMDDYIVKKGDRRFIFVPVLSQKIKAVVSPNTSTVYRRWFQLLQFTLNVKDIYGVPALDIDAQSKKGHTSSVKIVLSDYDGEDIIMEE